MTHKTSREDRARQRKSPLPFDAAEARERLATFFGTTPAALAAFLFGSRARGRAHPSSDVDIAVWVDPSLAEVERALLGLEWMARLPDVLGYPGDIDVAILNDGPPPLAWDVVYAPVVLYEAEPELALAVAAQVRRAYRDELPRLERQWKRLHDEIARGEFGVSQQSHR